jgi:hypothetical protein
MNVTFPEPPSAADALMDGLLARLRLLPAA